MYGAEFKGLPRVQCELRHGADGADGEESEFGSQWNNLELRETRRASNSCELNETPRALLINLRVGVGDRLQVLGVWRRRRLERGRLSHVVAVFCSSPMWPGASWGTQPVGNLIVFTMMGTFFKLGCK